MLYEVITAVMEISALRHPPVWLALDSRQLGGLESTLLHLAPLLDARGVLVEVVLISRTVKTRPLVRALQQAGIRCHLAADSLDFFQLLHHQRPCLLHCMGQRASLLGRVLGHVITSYSIHYTKLYEQPN